jgi:bacterial/archaeal transporter family-2 protein
MMASPSRLKVIVAVVASVISGMLVALQSRINGEFGLALGNGFLAALLSFSIGLSILGAVMLTRRKGRQGVVTVARAIRAGDVPWWAVIGGAGGGFLVLTQGLSAGVLGVALFTIAVVTGQTLGALVIDTRGWFGAPRVRLNLWRITGAGIVLTGVFVALDFTPGETEVTVVFLLPLLAGAGTGFQQAVNGKVRTVSESALSATFVNFLVGALVLGILFVLALPFTGGPVAWPDTWWLWVGGAVGAFFIAIQVTTVTIIGVLGLGVSLVTGQLMGSVILDAIAPVETSDLHVATVLGAMVTLAGSVMVTLAKKR